jgi:hypothetical protein
MRSLRMATCAQEEGSEEIRELISKLLAAQAMTEGRDLSCLKQIKDDLAEKQKEEDVFWQ